MPRAGVRFTEEFYSQIKSKAEAQQVSISDFIRHAVEQVVSDVEQCRTPSSSVEQDTLAILRDQLQAKDQQILQMQSTLDETRSAAEEASKRHDTIVLQMSKHAESLTEQNQLLLEDGRKKHWWQRRRKAK